MIKALFICSRNRLRSPTAESVFSARGDVEALSAGTSPDAETTISADLIEWSDIIFAMERIHRKKINEKFGPLLRGKKIVVLGIPDNYEYMDPKLVSILETKVTPYLRPTTGTPPQKE